MKPKQIAAAVALSLLAGGLVLAAADGLIQSALTGGGGRGERDGVELHGSVGQAMVGRSASGDAVLCAGWPGCRAMGQDPPAPLLLVDDDGNAPDVRADYAAVLNALGEPYDVWDTGGDDNEPDAVTLADYQAVIWFTGANDSATAGPGLAAETDLGDWLDGGNCLLITAQDYVFRGGPSTVTAFMSDYLGLRSTSGDEVDYDAVDGQGTQFGDVGPYVFEVPLPYAEAVDELLPDSTAETAFEGRGGGEPFSAAVAKDAGTYRTAFLGFPADFLAPADAQQVVNTFLEWCRTNAPIAGLAASSSSPTVLTQPTMLTATVTGGTQVGFTWGFGDGQSGSGQTVTHTYQRVGVYTATVTAANSVSSATDATVVEVVDVLRPDFSAAPLDGAPPLTVTFTNLTTGPLTNCLWDFGDGASSSACFDAKHTYVAPGTYTVGLTVRGGGQADALVRPDYVQVAAASADSRIYLPLVTKGAVDE